MNRILATVALLAGGLALCFYSLLVWRTIGSVRESLRFEEFPRPYRAMVVGFEKRVGARTTSFAPTVEVTSPDGHSFRFTSSRFGTMNLMSVGDAVEIVHCNSTDLLGRPAEKFEINSAFHLWIKDVLLVSVLPGAFVLSLAWTRFRGPTSALKIFPIRPLKAPRH